MFKFLRRLFCKHVFNNYSELLGETSALYFRSYQCGKCGYVEKRTLPKYAKPGETGMSHPAPYLGYQYDPALTSGSHCVAFGTSALNANTEGTHLSSFGDEQKLHDAGFQKEPKKILAWIPDDIAHDCNFIGTHEELLKRLEEIGMSRKTAREHGLPV